MVVAVAEAAKRKITSLAATGYELRRWGAASSQLP
jgi:hypothetical protein